MQCPVHVTLRVRPDVPSLRGFALVHEWRRSLAEANERGDFRVAHYSLQCDHAHLIVEAHGKGALARGMMSIGARLARAVNRVGQRSGPVLDGRYHHRSLRSAREVRRALAYVLERAPAPDEEPGSFAFCHGASRPRSGASSQRPPSGGSSRWVRSEPKATALRQPSPRSRRR